tara:strand:- start:5 stop:229 length:225 start_codon:yes stop_codon:yes gene_type:complete
MEYYDVEGHGDLARDPKTGSIINVNDLDYEHYVAARKAKKAKHEQVDTIEEDLANLKGEINEIKSLLKELVNGN